MSRSWPFLTAVAVVGVLAGVAIGGRPEPRDPFVISPEQIPTSTTVPSTVPVAVATTPTTTATTTGAAGAVSTSPVTTPTVNSGAPGDSTTSTTVGIIARVVIADASGKDGELTRVQTLLTAVVVGDVVTAQAGAVAASTTVYYRSGFDVQAARVATALGVDQSAVALLTDEVVSPADDQGDIVVELGPDVTA